MELLNASELICLFMPDIFYFMVSIRLKYIVEHCRLSSFTRCYSTIFLFCKFGNIVFHLFSDSKNMSHFLLKIYSLIMVFIKELYYGFIDFFILFLYCIIGFCSDLLLCCCLTVQGRYSQEQKCFTWSLLDFTHQNIKNTSGIPIYRF